MFYFGILVGGVFVFFFKPQIEKILVKIIRFIKKKDNEVE